MIRHYSLLTALTASMLATTAFAQQAPHVGYAFPAGGQQGRTVEVRVGGQFLDGVEAAFLSGKGLSVKVVRLIKPMSAQQANQLREQLKALMDEKFPQAAAAKASGDSAVKPGAKLQNRAAGGLGRAILLSAEEEQAIVDIREKLAKFVNRPPNPAIAETAVLQITTATDAPPCTRELRLQTPAGLSNPLVFQVGALAEITNQPVDPDAAPSSVPLRQLRGRGPSAVAPRPTAEIQLPIVVNGQILPGQVDHYRFAAKKGQHLVIAVSAEQLIPYIADAVPGWFQAAVELRDERGDELAAADCYRYHPDPVLHYEVPADGNYVVEIHDSVFRGREDFVYRMAIGEIPYATDVFPLGGKTGMLTHVAVQGWNLPFATFDVDDAAGRRDRKLPNDLPFARDALSECSEQEPNDSRQQAQKVTLPIVINGRVDRPGDRDVFRFEGKAGQKVVAEVYARRLGSPLDSVLTLSDAAGRQLAFNDDHDDPSCGLLTHHADSYLTATLPAVGTYYLQLYDAQNHGGPEYAYRLRIRPPRPDFDLRIVPSSVNARSGAAAPISVFATRRDGFEGQIALDLKGAPSGYRLSGGTILAGQQQVRCTLSVPANAGQSPVALHMEGRANVADHEIRREAIPADDMMQAFYYHHLVPAQDWMIGLIGRGRSAVSLALRDEKTVKVRPGGTAILHFVGPHGPMVRTVQFKLSEPLDGLAIQKTAFTEEGMDLTLRADTKLKPGWKGNVIVEAAITRTPDPRPGRPTPPKRRVVLGALPAATVEVVAK